MKSKQWGMVVDLNRCTGCMTCVLACKQEMLTRPGVSWNKILPVENEVLPIGFYFRHACLHCITPPCVEACPSGAIARREDGIVLVRQEDCSGSQECVTACPYQVIHINPSSRYFEETLLPFEKNPPPFRRHPVGKASFCTLCRHRIDKGRVPACVESCPCRVMIFGDFNDPYPLLREYLAKAQPLFREAGTQPKVLYCGPDKLIQWLTEQFKSGFNLSSPPSEQK